MPVSLDWGTSATVTPFGVQFVMDGVGLSGVRLAAADQLGLPESVSIRFRLRERWSIECTAWPHLFQRPYD